MMCLIQLRENARQIQTCSTVCMSDKSDLTKGVQAQPDNQLVIQRVAISPPNMKKFKFQTKVGSSSKDSDTSKDFIPSTKLLPKED